MQQDKDQSRRAKRQRRHAEKSLLRNWQVMYHQADFHTQGQDSTKHSHRSSVYEEELSNRQLWRWMVGKTRTTEASHRLKRGWVKWFKHKGGATQMGRERARQPAWEYTFSFRQNADGSGTFRATRQNNQEWQSRSWRMHGVEDEAWKYFWHSPGGSKSTWQQQGTGSQAGPSAGRHSQHSSKFGGQQERDGFRSSQFTSNGPSQERAADLTESAKARSLRVLGLVSHTGALTASIVQEAFRKCALAWHPDRHPGPLKHTAEAKFKEVQAAYQLLKVTCVQ